MEDDVINELNKITGVLVKEPAWKMKLGKCDSSGEYSSL